MFVCVCVCLKKQKQKLHTTHKCIVVKELNNSIARLNSTTLKLSCRIGLDWIKKGKGSRKHKYKYLCGAFLYVPRAGTMYTSLFSIFLNKSEVIFGLSRMLAASRFSRSLCRLVLLCDENVVIYNETIHQRLLHYWQVCRDLKFQFRTITGNLSQNTKH